MPASEGYDSKPRVTVYSDKALQLRAAFEEMVKFKSELWFHEYCFSQNGPAHKWAENLNNMQRELVPQRN